MSVQNNSNKTRKTRSDKKAKILINISQEDHEKLVKLSKATDENIPKSTLAAELVSMCVNHMDIIQWLMNKYNSDEQYRVIPIRRSDGKVTY